MSKILTKSDLKRYLEIESQLYSRSRISEFLFPSCIGQLLSALRHLEYYTNRKGVLSSVMKIFYHIRYRKLRLLTGLTIPPNTCAEGLTIYHTGSVVINSATKIGRNCCIMSILVLMEEAIRHLKLEITYTLVLGLLSLEILRLLMAVMLVQMQ